MTLLLFYWEDKINQKRTSTGPSAYLYLYPSPISLPVAKVELSVFLSATHTNKHTHQPDSISFQTQTSLQNFSLSIGSFLSAHKHKLRFHHLKKTKKVSWFHFPLQDSPYFSAVSNSELLKPQLMWARKNWVWPAKRYWAVASTFSFLASQSPYLHCWDHETLKKISLKPSEGTPHGNNCCHHLDVYSQADCQWGKGGIFSGLQTWIESQTG